jgi:hypothetical protein
LRHKNLASKVTLPQFESSIVIIIYIIGLVLEGASWISNQLSLNDGESTPSRLKILLKFVESK